MSLNIKEYEEIINELKDHFSESYGSEEQRIVIHFVKALLAKYIKSEE